MEVFAWIEEHWFELLQTAGIIGGLLFTAHTVRKDQKAREIGNVNVVKQHHKEIWQQLYERPQLVRILDRRPDLSRQPVTKEEELLINMLLLHLDSVWRAMEAGLFVEIEGLRRDVGEFLALPIPRAVWNRVKPFHNKSFVRFVETMFT
jgi:hypothetical protein